MVGANQPGWGSSASGVRPQIMDLSGQGGTPFTMSANGDFVWEDLQEASDNPIRFFRTYRATASDPETGPGPFTCIHRQTTVTTWAGGDPGTPVGGQVFYYLVTGENVAGDETVAGAGSDGNLRVVDTVTPCL